MVIGIGIDMIEIERIRRACIRQRFLVRCFTEDEIACIGGSMSRAAGNFAVKEAVSKVFGTGFLQMELKDIEVLRDSLGKPYVNLYDGAAALAAAQGIDTWHVSITNTKEMAAAFVVGECREGGS